MFKYISAFIVGVRLGLIGTGIVTLTILDNRTDNLQLPLEDLQEWAESLGRQLENLSVQTKNINGELITLDGNAKELVKTIRDEIDDWNRAGSK